MTALEQERTRLAARLAHRLESSILLVKVAVEREEPDRLLEQLDELSRRARGLVRCGATGAEAAGALRDAIIDWYGMDAGWVEDADGYEVSAAAGHQAPEVAELGEPLHRLLAGEAGAEVVSWAPERIQIRS